MAHKFEYPGWNFARRADADWLNGCTQFSFALWVAIHDIQAPAVNQRVWSHRGTAGQASFRLDTGGKFRFSVTTGGVGVAKASTTTPAQGTTYRALGYWKVNDASGMRMWLDGSEEGAAVSTTSQSGTYSPGTLTPLYLGVRSPSSDPGYCTIEGLLIVRDYLWTTDDIAALEEHGDPWAFPWTDNDHCHYKSDNSLLTRIPDLSGNGRHIEAPDITGALEDGGILGVYRRPWEAGDPVGRDDPTGGTPPVWTEFGSGTLHPDSEEVVTGLSNDTAYEFMMRAEDLSGNLSGDSEIVSATPRPYLRHVPRPIWFGHDPVPVADTINRLNFCGFESAADDEVKRILLNAEIVSAIKRSGDYACRVHPAGATNGYIEIMKVDDYGFDDTELLVPTLYTRFYIYPETWPTSNSEQLVRIDGTSFNQKFELRLRTDGKLEAYDKNPTLLQTGSQVLTADSWHKIDIMTQYGTDAPFAVMVNDTLDISGSCNQLAEGHGSVLLGRYDNRNSETYDATIDDIALDSGTWCGASRVRAIPASRNGYHTGYTVGAGEKWAALDEIPHDDDTSYIDSSVANDVYTCGFHSLATMGITGKVLAVKSWVNMRKNTASSTDAKSRFRISSTDFDNALAGSLNQSYYYGWMQFWPRHPVTGAEWIDADIDGIEAGPLHGNDTHDQRCTQALLMVEHR